MSLYNVVLCVSTLVRAQVGDAFVPLTGVPLRTWRAAGWSKETRMVHSHVWPFGGVVGRPAQPDLSPIHKASGFCLLGLYSWLVRHFTGQLEALKRKQEPPVPLNSIPRMAH